MRIAEIDGVFYNIGTLIDDEHYEVTSSGEKVRQIPLEKEDAWSTTWISEDGYCVQRYYNVWSEEWKWGTQKPMSIQGEELYVSVGSDVTHLVRDSRARFV